MLSASLALVGLLATSATAAVPGGSTLAVGGTVQWSGGPLYGTAAGGPEQGGPAPLGCGPLTCDDFLLEIGQPPAAGTRTIVTVSLATSGADQLALVVYPPGASDPNRDYELYLGTPVRLAVDEPGVWRIRVACVACVGAVYTGTASAEAKSIISSPLPPPGPLSFTNVRLPGGGGGEPGVVVDTDGRIFVNSPFTPASASLYRSLDGGDSFTRRGHFDGVPPRLFSADSDVAVAPDDGTVYAVNRQDYGTGITVSATGICCPAHLTNHLVYVSSDHGESYEGPAIADAYADRPWLVAGNDGVVYLGSALNPPAGPTLMLSRSTDHGRTWLPMSNVSISGTGTHPDATCFISRRPVLDPGDGQTLYLFYMLSRLEDCARTRGDNFEIWVAKSSDGGRTWSHHRAATAAAPIDHLWGDVDAAGNLYVAWNEVAADGSTHVELASSVDGGIAWRGPFRVDQLAGHDSNAMPAVAAGEAGRVDVVWYTSTAPRLTDDDATWTVALARTTDGQSATPSFTQSRVSPNVVHVGPLPRCPFCPFADFMSVDIDREGRANVVWNDDSLGPLLLMYSREIATAP
jgi:hypothetical protein